MVAVAAALLLAVLSLVIAASAQATNHPGPGAAAQGLTQVIVRPGQSLWSVAENADPDADTRVVIQQIIELNGLTGYAVFAGQRLWVPPRLTPRHGRAAARRPADTPLAATAERQHRLDTPALPAGSARHRSDSGSDLALPLACGRPRGLP